MKIERILRGILIIICAQIPLLAFFVYLLFLGVGISDFSRLAANTERDPAEFEERLKTRDNQLTLRFDKELGEISQTLHQLEQRLTTVSGKNPQWDRFVSEGGTEKLNRLAVTLADLNGQVASLNQQGDETTQQIGPLNQQLVDLKQQVLALDLRMSSADQVHSDLAESLGKVQGLSSEIVALKDNVAQQAKLIETTNNQLQDFISKVAPGLYRPSPQRKPVVELRFDGDEWELGHNAEKALNLVAQKIKRSGPKTGIDIYGFAIKNGPLNFSMALADKRARAVAEALRKKGIKNNPITIFVIPEYNASRDVQTSRQRGKYQAVHIYIGK